MARRVPFFRALGAVLLAHAVLCASCTSTQSEPTEAPDEVPAEGPIPPSFEPIVIPNPRAAEGGVPGTVREDRPVGEEDAGWDEKFQLAAGYAAGGFDDEARTIIAAALAQDPPAGWAQRFRQLRTSLRVRRIEEDLLRVDARGALDYVAFGKDVFWRVRIRNVSDEEVVFPPPGGDELSPSALTLTVLRRDLDIFGAELRRTWNTTVPIQQAGGQPVRIPAHRAHEVTVRVPADDAGRPLSGIRIFEMSGSLRVTSLRAGDREEQGSLPVRRGRAVALPDGFEPIARDPVGSMAAAAAAGAPTHLLVAAEFVPRRRITSAIAILARTLGTGASTLRRAALSALIVLRERAVGRPVADVAEPLVLALQEHPERAELLMEALTTLSGKAFPSDPRLWLDWWRRARDARTPVTLPRDEAPRGTRTDRP
jgi:hypothetical protein